MLEDSKAGEAASSTYYSSESSRPPSPMSMDEKGRFLRAWQQENHRPETVVEDHCEEHLVEEDLKSQHRPSHRRGHKHKNSDFPQSLSRIVVAPLRRSETARRALAVATAPRRTRLLLQLLAACVGLFVLSALLPASSRLSIWHHRTDVYRVAGKSSSMADTLEWSNQKLASGKGWGWRLAEGMKGSSEPGIAGPPQSTAHPHDFAYPADAQGNAAVPQPLPDIPCHLNAAAFASQYKLTPKFKYARRYVTAKPRAPARDKPADYDPTPRNLSEPLVNGWQTLAWQGMPILEVCAKLSGDKLQACIQKEKDMRMRSSTGDESRKIPRPRSSKAEAVAQALTARSSELVPLSSCSSSLQPLELPTYPVPRTDNQPHHIILGLASDAGRMLEMMPALSYSFGHSNLHLVLNLPKDSRIPELRKTLRTHGIRATIILSPEEDYLRRWVELPSLLLDFADPGLTRWAMVADDDTFFLSLPKLFRMLDKYDHTEERYIGALTDDWRQATSGMIGFGGAGVLLSLPLLEALQPHWPECKQLEKPADYRLAHCIYTHTHTRLTLEWGLHQTDLWDDIRGMLESGRDIVTWHHWKSWNTGMDPILIARAGAACGSECLLQRFLADGVPGQGGTEEAFLLVHGLSLTLHPKPLPDFGKTEVTWKVWANSDFSQSVGPTRPRIREGRHTLGKLGRLASALSWKRGEAGAEEEQQSEALTARDARLRRPASFGSWKETWLLEDVRLDEGSLGSANSWDNDGRGIREIYIKRASRAKGYMSAGLFGSGEEGSDATGESVLSTADVFGQEEEEDKDRAHRELEGSIKGLVGKLLGQGYSAEEQSRIVEEQLAEEEQDSVVELIWV
ncbi:unnamed protein product [Parajaminaea phylloscopi]